LFRSSGQHVERGEGHPADALLFSTTSFEIFWYEKAKTILFLQINEGGDI